MVRHYCVKKILWWIHVFKAWMFKANVVFVCVCADTIVHTSLNSTHWPSLMR